MLANKKTWGINLSPSVEKLYTPHFFNMNVITTMLLIQTYVYICTYRKCDSCKELYAPYKELCVTCKVLCEPCKELCAPCEELCAPWKELC